ncbi:MAG TPA: translation elongation factor Ts [Acidimicrobiales bacterium]|jgi:elongation factor Ts|nr:translation elongation factor Ts [Acidimicrobiales bacterium]
MAGAGAKEVQTLRKLTGAGVLDCKQALEATGGDLEGAAQWLRERGKAGAAKRQGREQAEGAVSVAVAGRAAAAVELRCETDFVAKSPDFVNLVNDLAEELARGGEEALRERASAVEDLAISLKENVTVGRTVRFERPEEAVFGTYLHVQADRGVNGVIVEALGASPELAHDVALHIAFARPLYLSRHDVPAEEVEAERATLEALSRNEGKPEAALPKIVEGRLNGWFKERCLLEQAWVKDEKKTVAELLGPARVTRFAQVAVGG